MPRRDGEPNCFIPDCRCMEPETAFLAGALLLLLILRPHFEGQALMSAS